MKIFAFHPDARPPVQIHTSEDLACGLAEYFPNVIIFAEETE